MENKTCKYFGKCGGCQTPNLSYPDQLHMKMRKMISLFGRYCHVDEIVGMENPYHYRTKAQAAFVRAGGGMQCGIYQSTSGRVIPAKSCLLENEEAQRIRRAVEDTARALSLTVYNPKNGRGLLRHVMVRVSRATGQALVVLATGTAPFPKAKAFTEALLVRCPQIVSIVRCINDTDIPLSLGEEQTVLYGSGRMEEILCGRRFLVSARAFLQVNPTQTEKLYRIALEDAALSGRETVLDACCGVGTLGILAAPMAARVTGVEINADAVADAAENAALNSVTNAEFVAADAGEYMRTLLRAQRRPDVLFVDPPRAGCTRDFLDAAGKLSPARIVYVSCNPDTLARDVHTLFRAGYRLTRVTPVDMFPFTTHVECVALLCREE
ncbi:MAG: 23S rRNA (uracil(1939)-C(5))-methyltransferase RlmD [Eubacteriales bacterium]